MSNSNPNLPKSILALRDYSLQFFLRDLLAGITVGLVALPLAMAFGIASGVTPQAGIYTAVVAGFIISALGGSRTQIGGPTGAFVVIVAGIVAHFGMSGLAMVTLMAGVLLVIMGLTGLGAAVRSALAIGRRGNVRELEHVLERAAILAGEASVLTSRVQLCSFS